LVQVPTTNVRPHVANLLLSRAPNFLHVMEGADSGIVGIFDG
jgi:hypothetical protein